MKDTGLNDPADSNASPEQEQGHSNNTNGAQQALPPKRPDEDGKKRKVALHVAYIGAGYAVSSL